MKPAKEFNCYTCAEGRTAIGQLVHFTCRPDKAEDVSKILETEVRSIQANVSARTHLPHGAYEQLSRYDIVQHDYAGGMTGYIEVLEIKDPPDGRNGIVIFDQSRFEHSFFTEWESLEFAREAFKKIWGTRCNRKLCSELPGFKRAVICGAITPWFYAIGEEELVGDYVLPYCLEDDPVYRLGKKFVVFNPEGMPEVKTCMGTRFMESGAHDNGSPSAYRLVYWSDGSIWDESGQSYYWSNKDRSTNPRPLEQDELWITEAIQQFNLLISGKVTEFSIDFVDGNKFVGKLKKSNHKELTVTGDYYLVVGVKGEKKPREGWIKEFNPTSEVPDILTYAKLEFEKKGLSIETIEVRTHKVSRGGKKWSGVFFNPKS